MTEHSSAARFPEVHVPSVPAVSHSARFRPTSVILLAITAPPSLEEHGPSLPSVLLR